VHNAFSKTAEAFNGYTNQSFDEDLASIKIRQSKHIPWHSLNESIS